MCEIKGHPKPLMEWILPDGSKVRAPFYSEDRRIVISADGVLTLRGTDASDTGLYVCIATNYLDADVLTFRVTVLSPDVEESEINGLQLSKSVEEDLTLDCSFSGSPEGSVSWILPDHSVLENSQANRRVYKNGTLVILGLTARDRGFYRCLVTNQLGIDLLVSQVTLSEERFEAMTDFKNEGSGMVMDTKMDSSLDSHMIKLNENPFSALAEKTGQESRTVILDRPYPRLRFQGRGHSLGRMGQRRTGGVHNRHNWSNRVFGKASRKIDPQKFAELMKKAHDGSKTKTTVNESAENKITQTGFIREVEIGSGGGFEEESLSIAPWRVELQRREFYPLERTSMPPPNLGSVSEKEISTRTAVALTAEPNFTPTMDNPDPVEFIHHTDPESQITFTAITTTERQKDAITFHTTQTIKSPQLSGGSTFISKQQINIIPYKRNRGNGSRRTVHGRRRLIKPNRITNIRSFINQFKQATVKKDDNTTGRLVPLILAIYTLILTSRRVAIQSSKVWKSLKLD